MCRRRAPQASLARVRAGSDGSLRLGGREGRSAYACPECLPRLSERRLLERALRRKLTDEAVAALRQELESCQR